MPASKTAFLVTGRPGCGKTTLIRRIVSSLAVRAGGFYTDDFRSGGRREGFRLVTLDGREAVLAGVSISSPFRVSRYGVDVAALDEVGVPALEEAVDGADLVVVDEIGKMEMASERFRRVVERALDSGVCLLGSIMLAPHPWADGIKSRPNVLVIGLTLENCGEVMERLSALLTACLQGRGAVARSACRDTAEPI
jgi:nucleoside-triphosphatase